MATTKDYKKEIDLPDLQIDKQAPVGKKDSTKNAPASTPSNDNDNQGETMDSSNKGKGPAGENL